MISELCEACYDVWFGDSDTEKKRGGGGNRAEDVKVFIEMTRRDRSRNEKTRESGYNRQGSYQA